MKNQYFGDENDYLKYGILRAIAAQHLKIQVGWMMTEDGGGHGIHTSYLNKPAEWRAYDPELFDCLKRALGAGKPRCVAPLEDGGLIPGAVFTNDLVPPDPEARRLYFLKLQSIALDKQVIFLDPDVGIAMPRQGLNEAKLKSYVQLDEIADLHAKRGFSLLIYQHLPQGLASTKIDEYLDERARVLFERANVTEMVSLTAKRVTFLLLAKPEHAGPLDAAVATIEQRWERRLSVGRHQGH